MAGVSPLRRLSGRAPVTLSIAAITMMVWIGALFAQWASALPTVAGFIPERLSAEPAGVLMVPFWLTPLTSLFVHAGFLHLALNVGALALFGRAIEPAVGGLGLVIVYVLGAIAAAAAFFFIHPPGLFWVGAGGGVGAVLGAYAILFGSGRSLSRIPMSRLAYGIWLCVGWTLLSILITYTYADYWAVFYAAPLLASFALGCPLGRLFLLFRYRKA